MKTLTFAVGTAVGYVLGTKAGREKYQQIVDGARTLGQKPVVQQAQSKIKDLVGQGTTVVSNKLDAATDSTPAFAGGDGPAATTPWTTPRKPTPTTARPGTGTNL